MKENFQDIDLVLIEANDGVECLLALYIAGIQNIKIYLIVSDENMNFLSGCATSKIIKGLIISEIIPDIPFYIVTALGQNFNLEKYPNNVRKIYSKPIDKISIVEILKTILI